MSLPVIDTQTDTLPAGCLVTTLAGEELVLHPDAAMYWPARKTLFLTDLHLGKAGHMRKHGLYIPGNLLADEITRLEALLALFRPQHLVILGDLFHSKHNDEWDGFGQWLLQQPGLTTHLVRGNHDILKPGHYQQYHIQIYQETWHLGPFFLCHHPPAIEDIPEGMYALSGHVHPAVCLSGKGRSAIRLACFWFGTRAGLLPAWGRFTGTATVRPEADDRVFALVSGKVMSVPARAC